jgi:hypothetical protein
MSQSDIILALRVLGGRATRTQLINIMVAAGENQSSVERSIKDACAQKRIRKRQAVELIINDHK